MGTTEYFDKIQNNRYSEDRYIIDLRSIYCFVSYVKVTTVFRSDAESRQLLVSKNMKCRQPI